MVLERRESMVCLIFKSLFTLAVNSVWVVVGGCWERDPKADGGFTFSIMKNGIVNENYEQTHKEKIDYEKANLLKLKILLDRNWNSRW